MPKITDFGLAKLLDGSGANPTRTGDLLGTPSYMAPEQVGGKSAEINAATDIYGLGAILYECLTGRPPFRGESPIETMLQVQSVEPVSPTRLQPRCPRDLATICLKCLSKLPSQRYASAAELADDLRRFQEGQPIRARPIGPLRQVLKWTRRQPTIAALAALLLLAITLGVGTGSWFWWQAELGKKKAEDALFLEGEAKAAREATLDRYRVALAHREWLANNVGPAGRLLDSCSADQRQSWEWRYLDRMRDSALHVLKGHTNTVQALAVHPSGQKFVSGSHDTELREWDLPSGRSRVLGSHKPSAVLAVAYSPDGRLLASSDSHHGRVQLRDAETDQVLRVLTFGGKGEIQLWGLAFDPTSRYLAVGGFRRLRVWDTHDQTWTAFEVADSGQIYKVAFSRDGRYLATASKEVKVWDWPARAKQPLSVWPGHGAATYDLAFSPDSGWLVSGGRDGLVRVRSLQPPQQEFTLNASPLSVTSVAFSPDGHRLATSGQDGDMHVWDVKTRRRLFTLHGHSGAVWDLEYTPDGTRLLSAGSDFVVNVWDASTGQEVTHLPASPVGVVRALGYGPEGRILAWGDNRGRVILWDTARNKEILRRDVPGQGDRAPIVSFAFSPNGGQVAWHRANAPPTLWDIDSAKEIPLPGAGPGSILGLAFFAEGKQLLAAYRVREGLRLCDLRTGRDLLTLARPNLPITQVIWSADTTFFVTVEDRKHVRVWDMATGQLRLEREYPPSVTFVTLSHDARFLAVGGVAGKVRVWDLKTNRETMAVTGHASNVSGLALTPDGHRLASSASDSTVKLWDTQTGNEVLTLRTQLHEHSPLAFSPDGADLASVNTDSRLQIWTTRTARRNP